MKKLKINNSITAAIKNGKWKNPGAKLYDALLDSFDHDGKLPEDSKELDDSIKSGKYKQWDEFLKEAYLVAPISDIQNSPYGRTPFSRSGCKYPHHVIKGDELVLSVPGVKAAYARAAQMGIIEGDIKEHLEKHLRELDINISEHNGRIYFNEEAISWNVIEENFDDINEFILENMGIDLYDPIELQEFDEKSHGKLKYDFRRVLDRRGHELKIVYSLDNIKIDRGEHRNMTDKEKSDLEKSISKTGHTDHQSHGQKVLAIVDLDTGRKLQSAEVTGVFDQGGKYKDSQGYYRIKVGEVDDNPLYKSTYWPKAGEYQTGRNAKSRLSSLETNPRKRGAKVHNDLSYTNRPINTLIKQQITFLQNILNAKLDPKYQKHIDDLIRDMNNIYVRKSELRSKIVSEQGEIKRWKHFYDIEGNRVDITRRENDPFGPLHTADQCRKEIDNHTSRLKELEDEMRRCEAEDRKYRKLITMTREYGDKFRQYSTTHNIDIEEDVTELDTLVPADIKKLISKLKETLKQFQESAGTLSPSVDTSQTLYRITYDGIGIYEALCQAMGPEVWKNMLQTDAFTWLPKPKVEDYRSSYYSYFTAKGLKMFKEKLGDIVKEYLPDPDKLEVEESLDLNSATIVYMDDYQVVIDIEKSISEAMDWIDQFVDDVEFREYETSAMEAEYYDMDIEEFTEKSHGKLKYDFRRALDRRGHELKIVYSLDNIIIDNGEHRQMSDEEKRQLEKTIKYTGHTDHQSHGQKVLAIVDLDTGRKLNEVDATGIFDQGGKYQDSQGYYKIKVGEIDNNPLYKSTYWPKAGEYQTGDFARRRLSAIEKKTSRRGHDIHNDTKFSKRTHVKSINDQISYLKDLLKKVTDKNDQKTYSELSRTEIAMDKKSKELALAISEEEKNKNSTKLNSLKDELAKCKAEIDRCRRLQNMISVYNDEYATRSYRLGLRVNTLGSLRPSDIKDLIDESEKNLKQVMQESAEIDSIALTESIISPEFLELLAEGMTEEDFEEIIKTNDTLASSISEDIDILDDFIDEYFEEKNLKYEFRMVIGENDGHLYKIKYELNPENIVSNNTDTGRGRDELVKNIRKTGHGNYVSRGNRIVMIMDDMTNNQVQEVSAYPLIHNVGGNIMPMSIKSIIDIYKGFIDDPAELQAKEADLWRKYPKGVAPNPGFKAAIKKSKAKGQMPIVYKVGEIDDTATYKTTDPRTVINGMLGLNFKKESIDDLLDEVILNESYTLKTLPDKLYFSSPSKINDKYITQQTARGIFMSPYIGISSIFIIDRSKIVREYVAEILKKKGVEFTHLSANYNIDYLEWSYSPGELNAPLKLVHMYHNIPELKDHVKKGTSSGYIYEVDVSAVKDKLVPHGNESVDREVIYKGNDKLPILSVTPHKVEWELSYKRSGRQAGSITYESAESMPKQTDAAEADKNGVRRKKLYIAFIEWCKAYNNKNTFGSIFDKDAFKVTYPFVPNEMRYFYRLANPILCVLGGQLTFFQVSELKKLNAKNPKMNEMLIFAATPEDMRVFNVADKKVYKGIDDNGELKLQNVLGDTFDIYIQNMINQGDILNGPIEEESDTE